MESSQFFPKWKYHRLEPARIVDNAQEEKDLGEGWADTPAAFNVEVQASGEGEMGQSDQAQDQTQPEVEVEAAPELHTLTDEVKAKLEEFIAMKEDDIIARLIAGGCRDSKSKLKKKKKLVLVEMLMEMK